MACRARSKGSRPACRPSLGPGIEQEEMIMKCLAAGAMPIGTALTMTPAVAVETPQMIAARQPIFG